MTRTRSICGPGRRGSWLRPSGGQCDCAVAASGTSPPPRGAGPLMALHTGGRQSKALSGGGRGNNQPRMTYRHSRAPSRRGAICIGTQALDPLSGHACFAREALVRVGVVADERLVAKAIARRAALGGAKQSCPAGPTDARTGLESGGDRQHRCGWSTPLPIALSMTSGRRKLRFRSSPRSDCLQGFRQTVHVS